ncbi:MAG: aldo/keto reductase [Pseudorhodoplanes sp.]|nr:aldo/keto reductase [Pseudorhodoplanes sp.]
MARLVIGTAQFGLDYGLVNSRRKLSSADAATILALARDSGVSWLDTAAAYGDAEHLLGECGVEDFRVVTKIPSLREPTCASVIEQCRSSLKRLRLPYVHALLIHNAADLMGSDAAEVYAGLVAARDEGLTERIGASVYEAGEAIALVGRFDLDVIQCPLSVLDVRMAAAIEAMSERGIAIHVRSIFLQGLALQPPQEIPDRLAGLRPYVSNFQTRATEHGLSSIEAALSFARDWPGVEGVVVGVSSVLEFKEIVAAFNGGGRFIANLATMPDSSLVDPRRWE